MARASDRSPARAGWVSDTFTLGPLRVDRRARQVWFGAEEVRLPPGALIDVLVALCEAWSEAEHRCAPVKRGALVRIPGGEPYRLGYDDVTRLRACFPTGEHIETVYGTGYRLRAITWPPKPSGTRRSVKRRRNS